MQQICRYYLGDPGDDEIFEAFTEGNLKEFLCYEEDRYCNPKVKPKKTKKTKGKTKKGKKGKKDKKDKNKDEL